MLFRCLVAVLSLHLCDAGLTNPLTVCEKIEGCNADIAIVVDKSGSIIAPEDGGAPGNWQILKNFIYEILQSSNFGTAQDTGAKYSVQFFANNANLKIKFNDCSDMPCIQNIIEGVNAPAGRTNTNAALQSAINEMFTAANGDRPEVPDIILLVTDGVPNPHNEVELNATVRAVKAKGIRVIGVGIGAGVDHNVMRQIVSNPATENYFQITSFEAIVAELSTILEAACIVCSEVPCWTDWSEWSACGVTCGNGFRTRTRRPRGERQCDGAAEQNEECSPGPCGGCDPKTINFSKFAYNMEADKNFKHDQILGSWYEIRYYLPMECTISDSVEGHSVYYFTKADYPNQVFVYNYHRDKLKQCCEEPLHWNMTQICTTGVYEGKTAYGTCTLTRSTFVYSSELFMVELLCIGVNEENQSCDDYAVSFWSRCKKARRPDIAKGEHILRKLCYPHMKRFVCINQDIDCLDSPEKTNLCELCEDQNEKPVTMNKNDQDSINCQNQEYDNDDQGIV